MAAGPTDSAWVIETIDAPLYLMGLGESGLVLDTDGYPHLAYGGHALYYAWYSGSSWQIEMVDPTGPIGSAPSLALDADNHPYLSYGDGFDGTLRYAYSDGTSWYTETVDSVGGTYGGCSSIALDANGQAHISYADAAGNLKYAYYDGTWHIEVVDTTAANFSLVSIALTADGHPSIAYGEGWDFGGRPLKYAHFDGVAWQIQTVAAATGGTGVSLRMDGMDRPHIAYCDYRSTYTCYGLRYAYYDAGNWQIEVAPGLGWWPSLALDAQGQPHISSWTSGTTGDELTHAWREAGGWQVETLPGSTAVGRFTALALGDSGNPHIAFFRDGRLEHAAFRDASWQVETVDTVGFAGEHNSLVLDQNGYPHVSYCLMDWSDCECVALRYARLGSNGWQLETVDIQLGYYGGYTSLALDHAGFPHISYLDDTNSALKYASFDGSSWQIETVAPLERDLLWSSGLDTSLALDSADRPHIAYHAGGDLRYASFDSTGWTIEVIDRPGLVNYGYYCSLALDSQGLPHISYSGWDNLNYASYDGTRWMTETVEHLQGNHLSTSLELDSAGQPHIAYGDPVDNLLRHAYLSGTVWLSETVAHVGPWGLWASLELDSNNRPHISFVDTTKKSLEYAHYDGAGWLTETVDARLGVYLGGTSLGLDAFDRPHIAYFTGLNGTNGGTTWTDGIDSLGDLQYAYRCAAVDSASIAGPTFVWPGRTAFYTATYSPLTATVPFFSWDNGATAPTATYKWVQPGSYTITVTVHNGCGEAHGSQIVEVGYYLGFLPVMCKPNCVP